MANPTTKLKQAAERATSTAKDKVAAVEGPSPNPMTNLIVTDILLRGGGQLMRHAVERSLLQTKYDDKQAKRIIAGRTMVETLISTALAKVAMRSVPGAILVGGGLLAKTLYDRRRGNANARAEGAEAVARRIERGVDKPTSAGG